MTIHRYAARRDANDFDLVAAARKLGWWLTPLDTPCDYLGWHAQLGWRPIEIKLPAGPRGGHSHSKLTKAQVAFHAEAHRRNAQVLVWRTVDDIIAAF